MAKMIKCRPGRGRREDGRRQRGKKKKQRKRKRNKDPFLKWKILNTVNNPVSINERQEFIYKILKYLIFSSSIICKEIRVELIILAIIT